MSIFNFLKNNTETKSAAKDTIFSRSREIAEAFKNFMTTKHPEILKDPILLTGGIIFFSMGAKFYDGRDPSLTTDQAIRMAVDKAEKMFDDAARENETNKPDELFLVSIFKMTLVAFAGCGAQWAAENPQKK